MGNKLLDKLQQLFNANKWLWGLFLIPVALFLYIILSGTYYPFYFDEAIYLTGGKLFSETLSLKAVLAFNEERSFIGGYGWYGPMYNLLYGLLPLVFSWTPTLNLWVHLLLYSTILFILFDKQFVTAINKKVFLLAIASSYVFVPFLFSYFPELLHVLFGILLFKAFLQVHISRNNFYRFIGMVLLFSVFRITYVFALFALVPLVISNVSILRKYLILSIGFGLGLLFYKLFHAKPTVVGIGDAFVFETNELLILIKTVKTNLHSNLLLFLTYFSKWNKGFESLLSILGLCILVFISVVFTRGLQRRQLIGVLLISFSLGAVLLTLYSIKPFFIEKQLSWLYVFMLLIVVYQQRFNKIVVFFSILLLPFMVYKTYDTIEKRIYSYHIVKKQSSTLPSEKEFLENIQSEKKEIHVLFAYNEHDVMNNLAYSFFPMSYKRKPILYTSNLAYSNNEDKFKLQGKVSIDYILSKEPLEKEGWQLKKELRGPLYLYEPIK